MFANFILRNILIQMIRAIDEVLIYEIDGLRDNDLTENCSKFALEELEIMQPVYQAGLFLFFLYLNLSSLLKYKVTFVNLSFEAKIEIINKWSNSRSSSKRDFIRLFRSLTLLSYYDNCRVLKNEDIDIKKHQRMLCYYNSGNLDG